MKKIALALVVCLGCTAAIRADDAVPSKTHPDSSGWENLFAEDLSNAIYPAGVWSFKDGILTATKDLCIWTKKEYANCIIDVEFKNAPGTNSGVFVYGTDLEKDWISNSVEIQILDDYDAKWAKVPDNWKCAGIFGRLPPTKQTVKQSGQWNRMTVTCLGPKLSVILNGELVTQCDMKKWTSLTKNPDGSDIPPWYHKTMAEMATKGHVGLQGKHSGVPISFRNLKIKPLAD